VLPAVVTSLDMVVGNMLIVLPGLEYLFDMVVETPLPPGMVEV